MVRVGLGLVLEWVARLGLWLNISVDEDIDLTKQEIERKMTVILTGLDEANWQNCGVPWLMCFVFYLIP